VESEEKLKRYTSGFEFLTEGGQDEDW